MNTTTIRNMTAGEFVLLRRVVRSDTPNTTVHMRGSQVVEQG